MAYNSTYYVGGSTPFVGIDDEIVGGLEITCAENPSHLGLFFDQLRQDGNDLADFFARASESYHDGKYITWDEELRQSTRFNAPGLITRTGNEFAINQGAVTGVLEDFNLCNDTDNIFFDFQPGQEVKILDTAGVEQHGHVVAVADDLQSATIANSTGGADWTVGTADLTLIPVGSREVPSPDDCGSCFRTNYDPATYMNNFVALDTCLSVDEQEFLDRGSIYRPETTNGYYRYDEAANMAVDDLMNGAYNKMMFSRKVQDGSQIAGGTPGFKGLSGVVEQVENRGFVFDGPIETKEDLRDMAAQFDYVKASNQHYVDASTSQYNTLEDLPFNDTQLSVSYEPFGCCQEDILKYGIKGVNIGGHDFYFRKWAAMQANPFAADAQASKYHFLMQPYNYNKIVFKNGGTFNQSHVNVVWAGNENKNWKLVRKSTKDSTNCFTYEVRYYTKFSVALALAHHWAIGKS